MSKNLVGELQTWPNKFVTNSIVNKYEVPFPAEIWERNPHDNSFIRLMFDDDWSATSYRKEFEQRIDYRGWPTLVRERMMIHQDAAYYVLTDDSTSSINIMHLNEDIDVPMLDSLLVWRLNPNGLNIIDSTSVTYPILIDTGTEHDLTVNYNLLTPLSKLIYCLLDLEIYEEYDHLDNDTVISTNVLEYFFELYINDKLFKFLSSRGWGP